MLRESPLIQDCADVRMREGLQAALLASLQAKFGEVPPVIVAGIRAVQDVQRLQQPIPRAVVCVDLDAFRAQLPS
jgi:hypothetical protein